MRKKIISLFICFCLVWAMVPMISFAATAYKIDNKGASGQEIIIESGNDSSNPGFTYDVDAKGVGVLKIEEAGNYKVYNRDSSTATDHRIEITADEGVVLTFAGLNIDTGSTTAVDVKYAVNFAQGKLKPALEISEYAGDVKIYLQEGVNNTLKSPPNCAGLSKTNDALLIIGGNGKLQAHGGKWGAGIGTGGSFIADSVKNMKSKVKDTAKNIIINGGTIEAIGGDGGAAGIGGGEYDSAENITINGGNITATGGTSQEDVYGLGLFGGAGIGSGQMGSAKNITINGGTVVAKGGAGGNQIKVKEIKVTAGGGAGIGAGGTPLSINDNWGLASNIKITGGQVTAQGGYASAGIGGGDNYTSVGKGGNGENITISGGTVKAYGGYMGSGIGGGRQGSARDIIIEGNAVVYARGGGKAHGIGRGGAHNELMKLGIKTERITIRGGIIEAFAENGAYHKSPTVTGGNYKVYVGNKDNGVGATSPGKADLTKKYVKIQFSGVTQTTQNVVTDNGTTKMRISTGTNGITWLQEESEGTSAWYGLTTYGQFEEGSHFHIRWLNKKSDPEEWEKYYGYVDEAHKNDVDEDNLWIFLMGVTKADGTTEYTTILPTDVYIELGDDWDEKDFKAVYISESGDTTLSVDIVEMVCPDGKKKFGKVSQLDHFSPYLVYDELSDEEEAALKAKNTSTTNSAKSYSTGDATGYVLYAMILSIIASCGIFIIIKKERKQ